MLDLTLASAQRFPMYQACCYGGQWTIQGINHNAPCVTVAHIGNKETAYSIAKYLNYGYTFADFNFNGSLKDWS